MGFLLRCTPNTLCRIRDGFKAGLGDLFATRLALAIAAVFEAGRRVGGIVIMHNTVKFKLPKSNIV